jgi:hypothetical protein
VLLSDVTSGIYGCGVFQEGLFVIVKIKSDYRLYPVLLSYPKGSIREVLD